MPILKNTALASFSTLLISSLIVGCATTQTTTTPTQTGQVTESAPLNEDPFINQQLAAVESLLDQHQVDEAQIILNSLEFDKLTIEQRTRFVLAQADLALVLGDGQEALRWLSGENAYLFDGLPLERQISIGLKRAESYEFAGKPLAAARERIFMAPVLDGEQSTFNHEQIWFDLQLVPADQLRVLAEQESSPDLTAWIELALLSQVQNDDLSRLLVSIEKWQQRHGNHPASLKLPGSLQMLREIADSQPTHIGVLLPLTGPLEKAGNAIRNGILTAWYQAQSYGLETPTLSFYDTTETEDIQNLYKQAITNGAESIIGPLSKTDVQRLAQIDTLPVPVLALNYPDSQPTKVPNFYQYGLGPEDEAIQIANDIWQQGIRSVLVVAPNSQWGIRVSDAFISHWQLIGGTISSKALFNRPDQYLSTIKDALNIKYSEQRHSQLQSTLDSKLEFEFRRRQDVDMVFMIAFPAQARQLKPILNYQRAIDIPVVATSYSYSGKSDADRDKDLEGVRFVEMPWRLTPSTLRNSATQAFPDSIENYASLVAFGADAYKLYPRLTQMSFFSDVRIQGVTGAMTMNEYGQIERELDWAIIEKGLVQRRPFITYDEQTN